MKKYLIYKTVAALILAAIFAGCTAEITYLPIGVSLDLVSITLSPGETLTLTPRLTPDEITDKTLIWSSSNPEIATVSNGVIVAITEGKTLITVTTNSGQKSATCNVRVAYKISHVTLDETEAFLTVGKSQRLTETVWPEDAPDKTVSWSSSNPDIVDVVNGHITAKAAGTATITVKTDVGARIATCYVRVLSENHIIMTSQPVNRINIRIAGAGLVKVEWGDGASETFTLSASPTNYFYEYSETSSYVVTIDGEGMTYLYCGTHLTNLDLSNYTGLTYLNCTGKGLTNLDVSHLTTLNEFYCSGIELTDLDVSKNTELTSLTVNDSRCNNLDVSKNTKLTTFGCNNSQVTNLNVSNTKINLLNLRNSLIANLIVSRNTELTLIICQSATLKSLVVSDNPALTNLNCSNNQLTVLDVSANIGLTQLNCSYNLLTELDVSKNTVLTVLTCNNNKLSTEALNTLFGTLHENNFTEKKYISILGNTGSLTCDREIARGKGWDVIGGSELSMTLQTSNTGLVSFHGSGSAAIDWGDGSGFEIISLGAAWSQFSHNYTAINPYTVKIFGEQITGFQVSNPLSNLDVSKCGVLRDLYCRNTQLTSLNVGSNIALSNLIVSNNQLTNLDLSGNTALYYIDCSNNQLSTGALNDLFGTLHRNFVNYGYKVLIINNNPGTGTCNRELATSKGWRFIQQNM